jgi:hypothetical protein
MLVPCILTPYIRIQTHLSKAVQIEVPFITRVSKPTDDDALWNTGWIRIEFFYLKV